MSTEEESKPLYQKPPKVESKSRFVPQEIEADVKDGNRAAIM